MWSSSIILFSKAPKNTDKSHDLQKIPGPGHYRIEGDATKSSSPVFGFGTLSRNLTLIKSETPGPGCYEIK